MNILTQIPQKIGQVKSPLQEVSRQLAKIGSSGSFATRLTVAAGDLHLEVQGVGRIRFPITPSTARRLCAVARPARHGFKDETRLDHRVRDTWEIAKSRISIDRSRWMNTLAPQLDRICRGLGLPQGCSLKAKSLHARLGEDGRRIRARRGGTTELAARVAVAGENDGGFLSERSLRRDPV